MVATRIHFNWKNSTRTERRHCVSCSKSMRDRLLEHSILYATEIPNRSEPCSLAHLYGVGCASETLRDRERERKLVCAVRAPIHCGRGPKRTTKIDFYFWRSCLLKSQACFWIFCFRNLRCFFLHFVGTPLSSHSERARVPNTERKKDIEKKVAAAAAAAK